MERQVSTISSNNLAPHCDDTECEQSLLAVGEDDLHSNPIEVKGIPPPQPPTTTTREAKETTIQASAIPQQTRKAKLKRKTLEFDILAKYDEQELLLKKALIARNRFHYFF